MIRRTPLRGGAAKRTRTTPVPSSELRAVGRNRGDVWMSHARSWTQPRGPGHPKRRYGAKGRLSLCPNSLIAKARTIAMMPFVIAQTPAKTSSVNARVR